MAFHIETDRLAFRELSVADLDFVAAMLSDPEVMRFYPKCYSRQEAEAWICRQADRYSRHGHGLWLTVNKMTGEPIGQVGLVLQRVNGVNEWEVGYLIHRPFWRQGFAAEAAIAVRDYAFNVLNKPRIISLIRPENIPSQGVAKKLGMCPEGRTFYGAFEHIIFSVSKAKPA